MGFKFDLTGMRAGRWVVSGYAGTSKGRQSLWRCRCDCGSIGIIQGRNLKNKRSNSCGCYWLERILVGRRRTIIHGQARAGAATPEYRAFQKAKARCNNPNEARYSRYGGRGIKFLFKDFQEFYEEIGPKPEPKRSYSLDRIDNNGNYEKGNVRWATWSEQRLNQERNQ